MNTLEVSAPLLLSIIDKGHKTLRENNPSFLMCSSLRTVILLYNFSLVEGNIGVKKSFYFSSSLRLHSSDLNVSVHAEMPECFMMNLLMNAPYGDYSVKCPSHRHVEAAYKTQLVC